MATTVRLVDLGPFEAGRWAAALADLIDDDVVVLPASRRRARPRSPPGPRARPAAAGRRRPGRARPGAGGPPRRARAPRPRRQRAGRRHAAARRARRRAGRGSAAHRVDRRPPDARKPSIGGGGDVTVVEVLPPDVATMDLAEATRIVGGGAGLDSAARFRQLQEVAAALGASMGATRVITDRAWVGHERQIGTTGVVVDPRLYLAFGISGAVQHTAGLGTPDHVVSVNVDPHCPMMQLADLAVVERRQRRPRRARRRLDVASRHERAPRATVRASLDSRVRHERALRRRRRRRRTRRIVRGDGARPRRPAGAAPRAGPVRRVQEHVRRRRLPAHPRRPPPAVVGGGAGPALDHPPGDDDPHADPGPQHRLPHRGLGPPALQRGHRLPARLRPLAGLQGRGRRRRAVDVDHGHGAAARRRRAGHRRAHRSPGRRRHRRRRDRLRRRQQLPGQGGRAATRTSMPATTRSASRRPSPSPSR